MDFQRSVLRATVSRFLRGQLLAVAALAAVMALIGGFGRPDVLLLFAVIVVGFAGVCLAFPAVFRRNLRSLFAGEPLLHWVYSADDWARYVAREREAHRRMVKALLWACPLLSLLLGAIILSLGSFATSPRPLSEELLVAAKISLFALPVLGVMGYLFALPDPPPGPLAQPEAYVSRAGVVVGDRFTLLRPPLGIGYEPGAPGLLLFHGRTRPGRTGLLARVPVPEGREAEAEALVQRLRGR